MPVDPKAAGDEVAAVHAPSEPFRDSSLFTPDSGQAWVRLALALVIGSIGIEDKEDLIADLEQALSA